MTLLLSVIRVALVFEYINGFHDTANSIATVVSIKLLTPRLAILMAPLTNLVGAFPVPAASQPDSAVGGPGVRQGPVGERGLHGLQPRQH